MWPRPTIAVKSGILTLFAESSREIHVLRQVQGIETWTVGRKYGSFLLVRIAFVLRVWSLALEVFPRNHLQQRLVLDLLDLNAQGSGIVDVRSLSATARKALTPILPKARHTGVVARAGEGARSIYCTILEMVQSMKTWRGTDLEHSSQAATSRFSGGSRWVRLAFQANPNTHWGPSVSLLVISQGALRQRNKIVCPSIHPRRTLQAAFRRALLSPRIRYVRRSQSVLPGS